ncbi:MAG: hypothetical protein LBT23_01500 [Synergistaceae bacterium]|jgi:hypothetical protein|nr:hypothetical protein [Synergistaceae bacterium]
MGIPVLSVAERRRARFLLNSIIDFVEVRKGKKKTEDVNDQRFFMTLENALSVSLATNWRKAYTDALSDLFQNIPDEISEEAIEIIEEGLLQALGDAFGMSPVVRRQMHSYIESAYSMAKTRWIMPVPGDKTSSLLSLIDYRAIDYLSRNNCFWLGKHYGDHIGGSIGALTQKALREGIGRRALAVELKRALGGGGEGETSSAADNDLDDYKYWDVVSSSALVRARSFGMISGMEEAGITEFEVLAMGDERMCDICGEMSGRVFSVRDADNLSKRVVGISTPDEFKKAMPWQSKPPVGISGKKLMDDGQSVPPFHGRCRCIIVEHDSENDVTEKSFATLGPECKLNSFDADTRIATIKGRNLPLEGLPGWKYDLLDKQGRFRERRFFGENGDVRLDIHPTGHGDNENDLSGSHAHEWQGKNNEDRVLRRPKTWEKEMLENLKKERVVKIEGFPLAYVPGVEESGYYTLLRDFIKDVSKGLEIIFEWNGHEYLTSKDNDQKYFLVETNSKNALSAEHQEFETVDDLLKTGKLTTGEVLEDVILLAEVEAIL